MKILVINGHTRPTGFIAGALGIIAGHLREKGHQLEDIRLIEKDIKDCLGCFHCLRTGQCLIRDDMDDIVARMLSADGFVVGSPVRNGTITACYKRFYERITYRLGFPLLLEDKYVLALSSVGYTDGKSVNRSLLGLQAACYARLSGYLFWRVGIPTRLDPAEIKPDLVKAAERLLSDIETRRPRRLLDRLPFFLYRFFVSRLMFKKSPEFYATVIECWRKKGYY